MNLPLNDTVNDAMNAAANDTPGDAAERTPFSLLMAGAGGRLAGAAGLIVLLWLAVAWALGDAA